MDTKPTLASVLVDFENVYYYFCSSGVEKDNADDLTVALLRNLKVHLAEKYNEHAISLDAYADFERIEENVQGALYLIGFETHNVLGTDHKNAADMKLCVDAMATLYTRPEITTFVFVAGDRDYIPVIRHLTKHGRTVRVVGFRQCVSGDLISNVGTEFFIDATQFVHTETLKPATGKTRDGNSDQLTSAALRTMLKYFADKPEIWLAPYLHKLRAELPELEEWERKRLVSDLSERGAIRIEKRHGETHDYSVVIVNWNHPDVQAANAD
ncbi:MAG TPA: NYN domain-containing protein [Bryobacteraceae bacterium]|nr:NYN domain-containing protein [Bryobacteraceae bacterium]